MPAPKKPPRKKAGRPTTVGATEKFMMRANPAFLRAIDEWRKKQPDKPSRAEAIRRLVERGMTL